MKYKLYLLPETEFRYNMKRDYFTTVKTNEVPKVKDKIYVDRKNKDTLQPYVVEMQDRVCKKNSLPFFSSIETYLVFAKRDREGLIKEKEQEEVHKKIKQRNLDHIIDNYSEEKKLLNEQEREYTEFQQEMYKKLRRKPVNNEDKFLRFIAKTFWYAYDDKLLITK